ncbi:MAG: hypothetical protein WCG08_16385, partial [Paludibacter sp.]
MRKWSCTLSFMWSYIEIIRKKYIERTKHKPLTHAYVHWLADVQLAVFAPAFTLSFHDSECSRKP